jgi:hypothetical protein
MRRREFIAALGGAAVLSLTARAMPVIGYLTSGSSNTSVPCDRVPQGLREYVDGCG